MLQTRSDLLRRSTVVQQLKNTKTYRHSKTPIGETVETLVGGMDSVSNILLVQDVSEN